MTPQTRLRGSTARPPKLNIVPLPARSYTRPVPILSVR